MSTTKKRILQDDLGKLITLYTNYPDVFELLYSLSTTEKWASQIYSLEKKIEKSDDPMLSIELEEFAQKIFDKTSHPDPARKSRFAPSLGSIFLEIPRFSTMLPDEVLALWEIREDLPSAGLSAELNPDPSAAEESRAIAVKAIDLIRSKTHKAIDLNFQLRVQSVEDFLKLRKFAKLDALAHCWPELARLLMSTGRSELIELEEYFVRPQQLDSESEDEVAENQWGRYRQNEQLVRFLQLRPLFRDIFPDEVKNYLNASQAVFQTSQEAVIGETVSHHIEKAKKPLSPIYQEILIDIQSLGHANYKVHLKSNSYDVAEEISLNWKEVENLLDRAQQSGYQGLAIAQTVREIRLVEDRASVLKELGSLMFDSIFTGKVREKFLDTLQSGQNYRIIWEVGDRDAIRFPLETLYVPAPLRMHLALTKRYSIVRQISNILPSSINSLQPPLRILAVFANPSDTAPLNVSEEAEILSRSLGTAIQSRKVELEILDSGAASYLNIREKIESFRPHIFHFVGHGVYVKDRQKGGLILVKDDYSDNGVIVSSEDFAKLLENSEIRLVVLNSCDTGVASSNDAVTGVAGALINYGIPSVIATMREVSDKAAIMFTREFYRLVVDGYDLETAIVETRKFFSVEKLDWSVYALFSGKISLSNLKLGL